jgi:hypothetical protein
MSMYQVNVPRHNRSRCSPGLRPASLALARSQCFACSQSLASSHALKRGFARLAHGGRCPPYPPTRIAVRICALADLRPASAQMLPLTAQRKCAAHRGAASRVPGANSPHPASVGVRKLTPTPAVVLRANMRTSRAHPPASLRSRAAPAPARRARRRFAVWVRRIRPRFARPHRPSGIPPGFFARARARLRAPSPLAASAALWLARAVLRASVGRPCSAWARLCASRPLAGSPLARPLRGFGGGGSRPGG